MLISVKCPDNGFIVIQSSKHCYVAYQRHLYQLKSIKAGKLLKIWIPNVSMLNMHLRISSWDYFMQFSLTHWCFHVFSVINCQYYHFNHSQNEKWCWSVFLVMSGFFLVKTIMLNTVITWNIIALTSWVLRVIPTMAPLTLPYVNISLSS